MLRAILFFTFLLPLSLEKAEAVQTNSGVLGQFRKVNSQKKGEGDMPLRIIADEMSCDQQKNICIAQGKAFAEKLNDPKKQTISADKFIVYFKRKNEDSQKKEPVKKGEESSGKSSLEKIEAFGRVIITDISSVIKCDEGVYYAETDQADLTGNVSVTQGKSHVRGTHGIAHLKEGTYKITNKDGRVEGIFYQEKKS